MIEAVEIDDKDYFSHKAISKSLLAKMDCPQKAFVPMAETPAMFDGTLAHCAILEPDEFDNRYIIDPKMPKRSKADKEAWEDWQTENEGLRIITKEQYDNSMRMGEAIRSHARASELLSGGKAEQAFFWQDERTGEDCKCKADYVHSDIIVDLKTTVSASPADFSRSIANFKYHWQDAWYSRGAQADRFLFIAIEKKEPFVIEIYELDLEAKAQGASEIDKALDKYIWHRDFEEYIGYTGFGEINTLSLPNWAKE